MSPKQLPTEDARRAAHAKKLLIINEIKTTEQMFVNSLQSCKTKYIYPIRDSLSQRKPLMSHQDFTKYLLPYLGIIELHEKYLTLLQNSDNCSIVFIEWVSSNDPTQFYLNYLLNYNDLLNLITKKKDSDKKFQETFNNCVNLEYYLVLPNARFAVSVTILTLSTLI
jgi:hypothetical protein